MSERPKQIYAKDWDTIADKVREGKCTAVFENTELVERVDYRGTSHEFETCEPGKRSHGVTWMHSDDIIHLEWQQPAASVESVSADAIADLQLVNERLQARMMALESSLDWMLRFAEQQHERMPVIVYEIRDQIAKARELLSK